MAVKRIRRAKAAAWRAAGLTEAEHAAQLAMEYRALMILADCPTGATELALARNGISRACLDALVRDGKISHRVDTLARVGGLKVDRFHIKESR